jgi:hypothetical protein
MKINGMPKVISQDEITVPGIIPGNIPVTPFFEQLAGKGDMLMRHGDIEVRVRAGLLPEEGIDCPTPVDNHLDGVLLEQRDHIEHITGGHSGLTIPGIFDQDSTPTGSIIPFHR